MNNMNVLIKEVRKEDIRDYMTVNTYGWIETYKGIMADEFLEKILKDLEINIQRQEALFEEKLKIEPDYKRYILYVDGKAVGIISICKSRCEKYSNSGEIRSLYLLNEVKKRGYGRLLFQKGIEELLKNGYQDMIIFCIASNPTTKFYEHMGGALSFSKKRIVGGRELLENVYYFDNLSMLLKG